MSQVAPSPLLAPIDLRTIRAQFPALSQDMVFLENAGGSQAPRQVADAVYDYLTRTNVQVGGEYDTSKTCSRIIADAHAFMNTFFNGHGVGLPIFGSSCTTLMLRLAGMYGDAIDATRDEIIVSEAGHEANIGPWLRLKDRGYTIKWWEADSESGRCSLDQLRDLLSERTRIVALPHVSNILGEIIDVKSAIEIAHEFGARVVLDSVAYAPHRALDVKRLGADWCVVSVYKMFGPHIGALWGKREAFAELRGTNHFYMAEDHVPQKFEPGGAGYELCGGLLGLARYLKLLAGRSNDSPITRDALVAAFDRMTELEMPLQRWIMDWLGGLKGVRIIGPDHAEASRVPTVSFVHERRQPLELARAAAGSRIGIKSGHMSSYRLCQRMGIDVREGVVRVSAVHYNEIAELEKLRDAFAGII